jgi:hypothetical protein
MTDQPTLLTSVVHPRRSRLDRSYDPRRRASIVGSGSAKVDATAHGALPGGGGAGPPTEPLRRRIAGGQMPYLVRHAHASDKHAWTGPDRLRPCPSQAAEKPTGS